MTADEPYAPTADTDWDRLLSTCQAQVQEEIAATIGHKFMPFLYVTRRLETDINDFVTAPSNIPASLRRCLASLRQYLNEQDRISLAHDFEALADFPQAADTEAVSALLVRVANYLLERKEVCLRLLNDMRLSYEFNAPEAALEKLNIFASEIGSNSYDDQEIHHLSLHLRGVSEQSDRELSGGIDACLSRLEQLVSFQSVFDKIEETRTLLEQWKQNCFLIVDRAGSGKTNLICNLAMTYSQQQPTILLSGRHLLQDNTGIEKQLAATLANHVPISGPFQSVFDFIEKTLIEHDSEFLIFIDGINENRDVSLMDENLLKFLSHHRGRRIRICLSCRDIYWEFFSVDLLHDFAWRQTSHRLHDFSEVEFNHAWRAYFRHYKIRGELVEQARERCSHPLLLRFFCEAYGNPNNQHFTIKGIVRQIRLKALFDDYWQKKIEAVTIRRGLRTPDVIAKFVLQIGHLMRLRSSLSLDASSLPDSITDADLDTSASLYTMILDENLVLEERAGKTLGREIYFVYDEFMEYVLARDLQLELENFEASVIESRIDQLITDAHLFRPLVGAIEFLSLMLKPKYGTLVWRQLLSKSTKWQRVILQAIAQLSVEELDEECYRILFQLARNGTENIRLSLLSLLRFISRINPGRVCDLLEVLAVDPSTQVRLAVIATCAEFHHPNQIKLLCKLVRDESLVVQLEALTALRQHLPPEIPDPLLAILDHSDHRVRACIIEMLPRFESGKVLAKIIHCLRDDNYVVRAAAILALANIGTGSVINLLLQALQDENHIVRENTILALGQLKAKGIEDQLAPFLLDKHRHIKEAAIWTLGQIASDNAERHLLRFSHSRDTYICAAVVEAVSHSQSKLAEEIAIRNLFARASYVRWQSASALSRILTLPATRALISALDDVDGDVRSQVIESLLKHPTAVTEPLLVEAWHTRRPIARVAALQALINIGSPHVENCLADALSEKNNFIQTAAIELLRNLDVTDFVPSLVRLLQYSGSTVAERTANVLSASGNTNLVLRHLEPMLETSLPPDRRDLVIDVMSKIIACERLPPVAEDASEQ